MTAPLRHEITCATHIKQGAAASINSPLRQLPYLLIPLRQINSQLSIPAERIGLEVFKFFIEL